MKLFIFIIFSIILISLPSMVFAATASPSATTAPSINQQLDQDLQQRIASRVAQLNLVEKRGIIGTVTDVSETQITLTDTHGNTRFVDVDELTKFSSPSAKPSFGISDITKGTIVGVLGLYNKESRRILARFVDVLTLPVIVDGGVQSIDSKGFTFELINSDNKSFTINIEDITKTVSYTQDAGSVKSGFSKLQQGQHVIVVGYFDIKNKTTILASRITVFPNLPVNPHISIAPQALNPNDAVVPSTGSGKKLVPIINK